MRASAIEQSVVEHAPEQRRLVVPFADRQSADGTLVLPSTESLGLGAPTRAVQPVERSRAAVRITPLIAGAYRPFGQPCCGTGERPASLGKQTLSRAT